MGLECTARTTDVWFAMVVVFRVLGLMSRSCGMPFVGQAEMCPDKSLHGSGLAVQCASSCEMRTFCRAAKGDYDLSKPLAPTLRPTEPWIPSLVDSNEILNHQP